jgi:hypothetical protein
MLLKLKMGASPLDDRLVGPPNIFGGPEVSDLCPLCLSDGELRAPAGELCRIPLSNVPVPLIGGPCT